MKNKRVTFLINDTTQSPSINDKNTVNKSTGDVLDETQNNYDVFYVDMINNYLEFYKKYNNKKQDYTFFDGIDTTDPTSTNHAMEQFFEKMSEYKINEISNPEFIEIYEYDELYKIKDKINDELYGIFKNGLPFYVSLSFFSLLIELTNLKNEDIDEKIHYEIISLK